MRFHPVIIDPSNLMFHLATSQGLAFKPDYKVCNWDKVNKELEEHLLPFGKQISQTELDIRAHRLWRQAQDIW